MQPDLIFMDVVMPGVNGFQATRKLASDPETRIDSGDHGDVEGRRRSTASGALRQGAVDYLVKPVAMDQLVRKAQAAIAA